MVATAAFAFAILGQQSGQQDKATTTNAPALSMQQDREAIMRLKGQPFPNFRMKRLDDTEITNKDLMGKVTVLDFWATWCGPCKAAAPKLEAMHKEMSGKGLWMIGANAGERGPGGTRIQTKDNAVAYVKEHGYTYTFTYGNDDLFKQLKGWGYPTFIVIDREGVVAEVMVGFSEARLRQAVSQLLTK